MDTVCVHAEEDRQFMGNDGDAMWCCRCGAIRNTYSMSSSHPDNPNNFTIRVWSEWTLPTLLQTEKP